MLVFNVKLGWQGKEMVQLQNKQTNTTTKITQIKITSEENQSVEDLDEKLEENLSRVDGTKDV